MKRSIIVIFSFAMVLSGCQTTGDGTTGQTQQQAQQQAGQVISTLLGAAAGAFLGSKVGKGKGNTGAMIIGALAGAMVGSAIFASLSAQDKEAHANTRVTALEGASVGEWKQWENPDAGTGGLTRIDKRWKDQNGTHFAETTELIVKGEAKDTQKTAYYKNPETNEWLPAEDGNKGGAWQPTG